jgi:hypothetical protein
MTITAFTMDIWFCFPVQIFGSQRVWELDLGILLANECGVAMIQECCMFFSFFVGLASALRPSYTEHSRCANHVIIYRSYFPSNFDLSANKFYNAYFSPSRLKP